MNTREEKDSLGTVLVDQNMPWGAQTQRCLNNFTAFPSERFSEEMIYSMLLIKKSAALSNKKLKILDVSISEAICKAVDLIINDKKYVFFPVTVWQTGSGTQLNMNVNEVLAHVASDLLGKKIHPNDHVNMCQSSNDVFPTAMHLTVLNLYQSKLKPTLGKLKTIVDEKAKEFWDIVKVGRTHLMDAACVTMGQVFRSYHHELSNLTIEIDAAVNKLKQVPLGGTAVGTGLNTPKGYTSQVLKDLSAFLSYDVVTTNCMANQSSHSLLSSFSATLTIFSQAFYKIINDIRWMSSGPRCGLSELVLPENEPGSSIMPGKVNPTQCESLLMILCDVMGNNSSVAFANSQGNFELNVFKPLMIHNINRSIELLSGGINQFIDKCLKDIKVNKAVTEKYVDNSLMNATMLNKTIGYDKASKIVRHAFTHNVSLLDAAQETEILTKSEYEKCVDPYESTNLNRG
jgi:fumarate hydratase, class II